MVLVSCFYSIGFVSDLKYLIYNGSFIKIEQNFYKYCFNIININIIYG